VNDWSDEEADNRCSRTTAISTRSDVAQIAHEAFGDWGDAVAAALWKFLRRSQSAGLILDEAPSNARELTGYCRRNLWHRASLCVAGDVHESEACSVSSLVGWKGLDHWIESVDQLPQGGQVRIGPERTADPVEKCGIAPVELARARGIIPLRPCRRIANPLAGKLRQCGVA
jgi:hypothetical protein